MLDPISTGLLTNALSELLFQGLDKIKDEKKRQLKPKLEKAYQNAIKRTENKFPGSKPLVDRIFRDIKVKNRLFTLRGGKEDIQKFIFNFAKNKKGKRDNQLNHGEIIKYFYTEFKSEFINSPELQEYLKKAYFDEIAFLSKDTNQKVQILPLVYKEIKSLKDDIAKLIVDNSTIKKLSRSNFSYRIGAFKLHLYGYSIKEIIEIFNTFYNIEKTSNKNNITAIEFSDEAEDSNFIKLIYRESLYKVIYPPETKYLAWLKQELNYVELTCFAGNHYKKLEVDSLLKNYIEGTKIKEVTFDKSITKFLKKRLGNISSLKYNPRIKRVIKRKNVQHTIKGKIGIFIGDPGFLRDKQVKFVIDNLVEPKDNERADVFYFKGESIPKIFISPIDIDVNRDGRIIGFFPKKNLDAEKARKSIYNYITLYGAEI